MPAATVILVTTFVVAFIAGFSWWLAWRWTVRRFGADTQPSDIEWATAADGWRLGLDRHRPEGSRRGVVITCHGLGANRFNMDLMPGHSLVERLVSEGWDVFNVDLRGNGRSSRTLPPGRSPDQWTFDDHVRLDVPAILEHVIASSGAETVHWVGHSMGGMVMYAHLGRVPDDARVASVVAVASPATLCPGVVVRVAGVAGRALALSGLRVPAHLPGRVVAPFAFTAPIDLRVAWPPNLTTPSIRRMLVRLLEPLSPTMIGQFTRWIREANFTSEDGADDYAAGLRRIVTPMCFVVGPRDQLAPPSSVRFAYDQIASDVSEFWHVGREEGASIDHCHGSILLGPSAPREVFPIITGWLDDRVANRPARDVSERPWMPDGQDRPSRSAMQDARARAIAASAA